MTDTAVQIAAQPHRVEARAAASSAAVSAGVPVARLRASVWVILAVAALIGATSAAWIDRPVALAVLGQPHVTRLVARIVSDLGLSGYMLSGSAAVALVAFLVRRRSMRDPVREGLRLLMHRALFVFATVAMSGIAVQLVKHLVGRARPRSLETLGPFHFDLFSIKASLASFPSGHTTSIVALAVALGLMLPRLRWWLGSLALGVAASRSMVGAHYVSDVVGGAALGAITTIGLTIWVANRSLVFTRAGGRIALQGRGAVWPAISEAWLNRGLRA